MALLRRSQWLNVEQLVVERFATRANGMDQLETGWTEPHLMRAARRSQTKSITLPR